MCNMIGYYQFKVFDQICLTLASNQIQTKYSEDWFRSSFCKSHILCSYEQIVTLRKSISLNYLQQRQLPPGEARTHNLGMTRCRLLTNKYCALTDCTTGALNQHFYDVNIKNRTITKSTDFIFNKDNIMTHYKSQDRLLIYCL